MASFEKLNKLFKGDKVIWIVFLLLCVISIVEVYSASSTLGYRSGNYWSAAVAHAFRLGIGIFVMITLVNIKCRYFKLVTPVLSIVAVPMLIFVLFFGVSENDASRWISFGSINIQPSELGKAAMVFVTAQILSAMQTKDGAAPQTMKYILIASLFLILPIVPENLSTATMLAFVVFLMMLIGRVPMKQLGYLVSAVLLLVALAIAFFLMVGHSPSDKQMQDKDEMHLTEVSSVAQLQGVDISSIPEAHLKKYEKKEKPSAWEKLTHRSDTWKGRILGFFDKRDIAPEDYDLDKNSQVGYSRIAIVSSNIVGKGPGNSVQRDFLPQAYSDFIYAIIVEEFGLFGAIIVAFLYIVLLYRTNTIAKNCKNPFPAYLAMGLALLIVTQALFNMSVAVGIVPITGQPLPLISRGGTSSIINCAYLGVILSISRTAAKKDAPTKETPSEQKAVTDVAQA